MTPARAGAPTTGRRPARRRVRLPERRPLPARPVPPEDLGTALARAVGPGRAELVRRDLDLAAKAYEAERYTEAFGMTRRLAASAPEVPEIRELHGLVLYRMQRWEEAIVELEAFRAMTGTAEQDHVLADCYRALGRWSDVEELWDELRDASPNPEVVTEGRIVMAGSLADRGELGAARRLLEKGWQMPRRPMVHHLRRAYAMADLYERSGQPVRSRELFRWIRGVAPDFGDVEERLRALG